MNKKIFYCEWRHEYESEPHNHIFTCDSFEELLQMFIHDTDNLIIYFACEEITNQDISTFERRLTYRGKYSL